MTLADTFHISLPVHKPSSGAGAIGEKLLNERIYMLPHRPPTERRAILWNGITPRPVPVVFSADGSLCQSLADGSIKAWYDADELVRALAIWRDERGVRLDAAAIVAEVFEKGS